MNSQEQKNQNQLRVTTIAQYIKAISFTAQKSKLALTKPNGTAPNIDYQLAVQKIPHEDSIHEVVLQIQIASKIIDEEIFNLKMEYAGLFKLEGDVLDAVKDEVLSVNCITLLFPFARREIAEILVGAGFQPVLLDPIDFGSVYLQYKKQEESKKLEEFAKLATKDASI